MRYALTPLAKMSLAATFLVLFFLSLLINSSGDQDKATGATPAQAISTLWVKVQSENGTLIEGAEIYLNNEYKGKTGKYGESKGSKALVLEQEKNSLVAKKEGYVDSAPTSVSGKVAGEQRVTLTLEKELSSLVVAVKDVYGRPLEKAVVTLKVPQKDDRSVLSDEKGKAVFKKVDEGEYELEVEKKQYFSKEAQVKVLTDELTEEDEKYLTIILEKIPQLTLEIVDLKGNAIEEVEVTLYTKKEYNTPGAFPSNIKFTSPDGKVIFNQVELDETYMVVAKKEGFRAQIMEKKLIGSEEVVVVELNMEE